MKVTSIQSRVKGWHGVWHAAFALVFLFAQVVISVHHTDIEHHDDHGAYVECDVCTISPNVFDATSLEGAQGYSLSKSVRLFLFPDDAPQGLHTRSGGARAPPQTQ